MKTAAERTRTTVSRPPQIARQPFFSVVQTKMTVNAPGDRHEREAEATADRIMRTPVIQRAEEKEKEKGKIQRFGTGPPVASDAVQSGIRAKKGGGHRLEASTRRFMESRFDADFGGVRVHSDAESAQLSHQLGARAFTTENHIFFGGDQYRPGTSEGRHLLAHELTHTIQQGAAIQRSPKVSTAAATPAVQRWDFGLGDVLNKFADKANLLPGFRLLTIVLGFNPINMAGVDRSAGNILRALIETLPLGSIITTVLDNYGVFQRAGAWVEQQIGAFANLGSQIRQGISLFLKSLKLTDIGDLDGVWERAKAIFTTPITSLKNFALGLVTGLMDLVRDAILRPLAELLRPTRGYDLLCAVLGKDPVTGEPVPRNAETLIGGFMKLIGREDIWENIKKGNAIARAWAWFQSALSGLMAFVQAVPVRVVATLKSITWQDVVSITGVVGKVVGLVTSLAGQFFSWAKGTVLELLEIIFSVVAPGVIPYVKKAQATFHTILANPIGFVGNLVRAGRLGFEMFASNIVEHLKAALIKWITGPLGEAGVYIPKSFDLLEIIKCVLSVLGLTWQNIRAKLVKIIPEPVLVVLEKTASILVTLVKDGPAAAWDQIKAELTELKSMLIAEVTSLVTSEIVKAAVTKIVSMINPAGAVIQAIIAIYNTVMFFVEKISQIAATVAAFVDSMAAIAAGQLTAAAQKVEQTMANTLVVVISFLARLVGLGGVPAKIVAIIKKIRQPIDKGLDRVVAWLGALLQKIGAAVKAGVKGFLQWWKKSAPVTGAGESHTLKFTGEGEQAKLVVESKPDPPAGFIVRFNPPPEKKREVEKKEAAIDALEKDISRAQAKTPPDEVAIAGLDKKLTAEFNALGDLLSSMIGGSGDEGTAKNPLPCTYPKRRASAYPNIYIGPLTKLYVPQKALRAAASMTNVKAIASLVKENPALAKDDGFSAWKGTVRVCKATERMELEGETIGLAEQFASLAPGVLLVYDDKGKTGGGGKINAVFKNFGFSPSHDGYDGDHVMERQLGGPDHLANLWPLPASENRSSGSTVKNLPVTLGGKEMTVHEARGKLKREERPLHLLVRKTL